MDLPKALQLNFALQIGLISIELSRFAPKFLHKLYQGRKDVTMKFNLKRMIAGGRLYNYCDYAGSLSPLEYAHKVVNCEIHDLVLSFDLVNGFNFIKILPNYLEDARSLNYASFIEWINPHFSPIRVQ